MLSVGTFSFAKSQVRCAFQYCKTLERWFFFIINLPLFVDLFFFFEMYFKIIRIVVQKHSHLYVLWSSNLTIKYTSGFKQQHEIYYINSMMHMSATVSLSSLECHIHKIYRGWRKLYSFIFAVHTIFRILCLLHMNLWAPLYEIVNKRQLSRVKLRGC